MARVITENQLKYGKAAVAKVAEMRVRVMDLRKKGLSFRAIGAELEISKTRAHTHYKKAMDELLVELQGEAKEVVALEISRLDSLMEAVMPKAEAGDLAAVDRVLKIQDRRAKYLGLDAPVRAQVEGKLTLEDLVMQSWEDEDRPGIQDAEFKAIEGGQAV